ncbi:c-type cytochrome [Rhizobium leguminosarum]|uniref:Cytochrome c family protein n=1 Tax=Rhizobium leguminosarum TaxID=384 RepID=A0A2Z4YPU6_RHILE|nr:cytochrome c [Rhizobium leguminosarum]AXA43019.1 Cytochrome c family protein [Rhizobium leguminosarum]
MPSKPILRTCWSAAATLLEFTGESAAADRINGQRIAERWCAECHVVASGQQQGSDKVPTFAQIGGSKHFDEASLAAFLMAPYHSRMPNLSLTRSEISDLIAYIRSHGR